MYLSSIPAQERKYILENEYNISMTDFSKEGQNMCNLGECIYEKGIAQGLEQGIEAYVEVLREYNNQDDMILHKIMEKFNKTCT